MTNGRVKRAADISGCVPSGFKVAGPSHIAPHPAPIMEDESMNAPDIDPDILFYMLAYWLAWPHSEVRVCKGTVLFMPLQGDEVVEIEC